jgi:hypothetical protein
MLGNSVTPPAARLLLSRIREAMGKSHPTSPEEQEENRGLKPERAEEVFWFEPVGNGVGNDR